MFSTKIRNQNAPLNGMFKNFLNTLKAYIINLQLILPTFWSHASLLFLTSAGRCHKINYLDMRSVRRLFVFKSFIFKFGIDLEKRGISTLFEIQGISSGEGYVFDDLYRRMSHKIYFFERERSESTLWFVASKRNSKLHL